MERSGSGGMKAGDVDGGCGGALACCLTGSGVDSAACCCGRAAGSCVAAGAGELEGADVEERSKASEACAFGSGGGSSFFAVRVASSGETRSTVIGSAV